MNQYLKFYKPTLGHAWLMVALVLVGSVVIGGIGLFWREVPQSLTYFLMMMIPLLWCWWMGRQAEAAGIRPLAIHQPHYGKLPAWGFFALIAIALVTLSFVIEPTASFIPMPDSIKAIFEAAFVNSPLWDMIISTCILAPLLEELLCRGMVLRGLLTRMKPGRAIFWSALIFAVMHMNPWQSIPAFLIGLLLGWVYWRTHSLWATIFMHCLNNSLSTFLSRVFPDVTIETSWRDMLPTNLYWICYAAALVLLVVTIYILHEKTVSPQVQNQLET